MARPLLCNQGTTARRVGIRPWQLPLGVYDVRMGPDADFDDRIDFGPYVPFSWDLSQPGQALISAFVGSGQIYVVEFKLQSTHALTPLPDPAIGPRDIRLNASGSVTVRVHNVGAVDLAAGRIEVTVEKSGGSVSSPVLVGTIAAPRPPAGGVQARLRYKSLRQPQDLDVPSIDIAHRTVPLLPSDVEPADVEAWSELGRGTRRADPGRAPLEAQPCR